MTGKDMRAKLKAAFQEIDARAQLFDTSSPDIVRKLLDAYHNQRLGSIWKCFGLLNCPQRTNAVLKLRCKRHPRYSGVQSPKASCEGCIYLWEVRQKAFERRLEVVESKKRSINEDQEESRP